MKNIRQNHFIVRAKCTLLFLAIVLFSSNMEAQKANLRFYGKYGALLNPPSLEDLEYDIGFNQTLERGTFGFGMKVIAPTKGNIAFGGEFGLHKLFYSKANLSSTNTGSYHSDREWGIHINPMIRFDNRENPFFLDLGAGLHIIFWDWNYYSATSYSTSNSSEGTARNFGINAEAGVKIKTKGNLTIPISVRSDVIMRYGTMIQLSACLGVEF